MGIGSAIGAVGSVIGGIGQKKAADKANAQSAEESRLAREDRDKAVGIIEGNQGNVDALQEFLKNAGAEGMEYAQGLLDDWESTFGGIQDNLSDYYNNLDPDKFATGAKAEFQQELQKSMKQYDETMAAAGMQSAGMKAQTAKEAMFKQAETNAQIDINAPEQVAQMQQGWLNYGDPQRAGAENAMNKAMGDNVAYNQYGFGQQTAQNERLANAYLGNAGSHEQAAANYGASGAGHSQAAGNMFGSAIKLGINGYNQYQNNQAYGSDNGWLF